MKALGAWAWAIIVVVLTLGMVKVGALAKDQGKHEAEKDAVEKEGERASELAKRLNDGHDINTHFGMRDNGEDKDSEPAPRFEIPHTDNSPD